VATLASLGVDWVEGPPLDGWAYFDGWGWVPIEIKSAKGRLTEGQEEFISRCHYYNRKVMLWRSPEDAIKAVQAWRNEQNHPRDAHPAG
jgi:hypothetical protein